MKNMLILAAAAAVLSGCADKNRYVIEGTLHGANERVYLYDSQRQVIDSAAVDGGRFRLTGTVETPDLCFLSDARNSPTFTAELLLEPGTITVADDPRGHGKRVTGTPSNDAATAFADTCDALGREHRDTATSDERRRAIEKQYEELTRSALEQNRSNIFGAKLLAHELSYELSGQELLDEIARFPASIRQSGLLVQLGETARQKIDTDPGAFYADIAQSDAAGRPLTLGSVVNNPLNKYVLVDFWASWCGPCMREVPHLKRTYDAFHSKGFEIYAVSFDQERDEWLAAVAQHNMNWLHVSDLNGFENQAAKDYAVEGIPSNILIARDGRIVARDLRGAALYEKIAQLLGQ